MANTDREQIQARLIQKAIKDADFKEQLIADPRAAIAKHLGAELPSGTKVTVLQESVDHFYVVLPPSASGELGESDLDAVVGGAAPQKPKTEKKEPPPKRPNGCSGFCMGTTTAGDD